MTPSEIVAVLDSLMDAVRPDRQAMLRRCQDAVLAFEDRLDAALVALPPAEAEPVKTEVSEPLAQSPSSDADLWGGTRVLEEDADFTPHNVREKKPAKGKVKKK